ncbi:MAG: regulatory protein RecX [Patescibacteria group bacterium]
MRVTAIKEQKRRNRVNIYLDNKFAFGLSKEALVDFALFEGKELTEAETDRILEQDQKVRALQKCFRWLGIRARSEKELEKKLREKGFAPKIIQQTIQRIKELGYLNDEKFACLFIEMRKAGRPKGKFAIQRDLKQKGIDEEIIKKTLRKFYPENEEIEKALNLAKKKVKTYGQIPQQKIYQKLANFLAGRGFGWPIIKKVLDKILKSETIVHLKNRP